MTDAIREALEAVVRFAERYHCKMPTLGDDEALAALGDGAREALAALVTPADVGELVERLRKHETYAGDYMLIGEEDKTIRETVAALERVVRERDEARAEIERMTPQFVAYEYLESPAGREIAEAKLAEARKHLANALRIACRNEQGAELDTARRFLEETQPGATP